MKIRWVDRVTNEKLLRLVGEERCFWRLLMKGRDRFVGHILGHPGIASLVMEGRVEDKNCRGGPRLEYVIQIASDVVCGSYVELKRLAQDREAWTAASN